MTTTKQLADQHGVSVTDVKKVLRKAFPGNEFKSPDYSLSADEVAAVVEGLPAQRAARRAAPREVAAERAEAPLPGPGAAPIWPSLGAPVTPRPGSRVRLLVHLDVVEFLENGRGEDRPRQAAVLRLLRGMLVEGRAQRSVKGTVGVNRGWLRAPIGDNGGSHYYLWHALAGTTCVAELSLGRDEVVVRAVRHHDETKTPISAGARSDYVELDASDYVSQLESSTGAADTLSDAQRSALERPGAVTITKGYPGAGKTTLHLERTRRHTGPILFMTFGAAQCAQGQRWLETYAPPGQVPRALTHADFLARLAPGIAVAPPLDEAERALRAAVGHEPRLGPWRDRWTALHAELRAWYWGRALPVDFRGVGAVATPDDLERAYRHRRGSTLPEDAIDAAVIAARALPAEDRAHLFGDLDAARALASELLAGRAIPPALSDLEAILIDEVQDLTLVEALVCVLVARRPAVTTGTRPAFHVAGDEGQTVRATDFDWGELKDLINQTLGAPTEVELPGNLRSPRAITHIINNSWALYRSLEKGDRPRGSSTAEVTEAAIGSVLWVDAGEDGLRDVCAVVAAQGATIIYPGVYVPADVVAVARAADATVQAAPDAKGLDFRVAVVLDVGRRAHRLAASASDTPDAVRAIETRFEVDAIRVALSRATETLVLVERPLDSDAQGQLRALCQAPDGRLLDGVVTVDRAELASRLDVDTQDRVEIVSAALEEFDAVFGDDTARALRTMARARGWLGDTDRAGAVQGELRLKVYRAHGLALLAAAAASDDDREARLTTANHELYLGKEPDLSRLALDTRDALKGTEKLKAGVQRIAEVVRARPEHVRLGVRLMDLVLTDLVRRGEGFELRDWDRVVKAMEALGGADELARRWAGQRSQISLAAAEWAVAQGPAKSVTAVAETALPMIEAPPVGLRAKVAERRSAWDEAIDLYREAGMPLEALRIARDHDDAPARSLDLARVGHAPDAPLLERLARVHADLAALAPQDLTDAERTRLVQLVRERFGKR
ncbi:MAG: hypothetical protein R3B06_25570 [Kofleriaceae bacterium]